MKITIRSERCQGHARCASLAPEIFDLDDDGYACVLPGRETVNRDDTEARDRITLAVDNCPEEAIMLEDDDF